MPKLVKLALFALVAAQESTTEFTTVDQAALEAAEEAARQAEAEAHAAAEAAAQAAALAARITGTCWSCGVMNNVTDFGPQDTAADMYAKCLTEGEESDCFDERTTCTVVERKGGSGWIMSIEAGCKAHDACETNQAANFDYNECQREEGKPSKCTDCCSVVDSDKCNLERWALYIDAADAVEVDASVTAAWNNTLPEEPEEEEIEEE